MIQVNGEIAERRDTTESWNYVNPILPDGQLGWEVDIYGHPVGVKMGNGAAHWVDLAYWFQGAVTPPAPTTITAGVTATPLTIAYAGNASTDYTLRRTSDNSFDWNTNVQYDGSVFTILGEDDGSGKFADSYVFAIKP